MVERYVEVVWICQLSCLRLRGISLWQQGGWRSGSLWNEVYAHVGIRYHQLVLVVGDLEWCRCHGDAVLNVGSLAGVVGPGVHPLKMVRGP